MPATLKKLHFKNNLTFASNNSTKIVKPRTLKRIAVTRTSFSLPPIIVRNKQTAKRHVILRPRLAKLSHLAALVNNPNKTTREATQEAFSLLQTEFHAWNCLVIRLIGIDRNRFQKEKTFMECVNERRYQYYQSLESSRYARDLKEQQQRNQAKLEEIHKQANKSRQEFLKNKQECSEAIVEEENKEERKKLIARLHDIYNKLHESFSDIFTK